MRQYYLNAMGIEQWVLRGAQVSSVPCYSLQLMRDGNLVGVLLAEAPQKNKKVAELLQNICRALKVNIRAEWFSCTPDLSGVIPHCRFVILMGEFSDSFDSKHVIKTHSPERLLSEPTLKRETWDDLQQALSLMPEAA